MADDKDGDLARDNSQWTTDQDGAICKLKKDGKSWATIAESVGSSKNLVRKRFQFMKSQIEAAGHDTDSIGENWAEDMRQQGKEIPSPEKPSSISSPPRSGRGKKHNEMKTFTPAVGRLKTGKVNLMGKIVSQDGIRFADSSSSPSWSSSSSSSEDNEEVDYEEEREEQKRFLYHEYWSEVYPDQKTYEPDQFWSEGDCKVLAVIEAKDAALKYKRLQADFFNATGRMVSEEILKYKIQHGK